MINFRQFLHKEEMMRAEFNQKKRRREIMKLLSKLNTISGKICSQNVLRRRKKVVSSLVMYSLERISSWRRVIKMRKIPQLGTCLLPVRDLHDWCWNGVSQPNVYRYEIFDQWSTGYDLYCHLFREFMPGLQCFQQLQEYGITQSLF